METTILSNGTWLQWGAVIGASLVAALTDARARRIPNMLTGPLVLAGLAHAGATAGLAGFGNALLAALLISLPFVLLFVFAGGGAGDAKLMAGIGAWLGLATGTMALASVAFAGVLLALAWGWFHSGAAQLRGRLALVTWSLFAPVFGTSWRDSSAGLGEVDDEQKMPYGIAICLGTLAAFTIEVAS